MQPSFADGCMVVPSPPKAEKRPRKVSIFLPFFNISRHRGGGKQGEKLAIPQEIPNTSSRDFSAVTSRKLSFLAHKAKASAAKAHGFLARTHSFLR